jgi:hypothetical protein
VVRLDVLTDIYWRNLCGTVFNQRHTPYTVQQSHLRLSHAAPNAG